MMTQQIDSPAVKSDILSLFTRTHMVEEEK